jgi:hypothetical protein
MKTGPQFIQLSFLRVKSVGHMYWLAGAKQLFIKQQILGTTITCSLIQILAVFSFSEDATFCPL